MKLSKLASLCLMASLVFCVTAASQAAETAAGKISGLQGKAQIFVNGRWVPAALGSVIYPSSTIQTGYNSKVIVTLRTGSQLSLKPNTTISFNQIASNQAGDNVEVHLANGGVNSFVPRADEGKMNVFKVRSATAVAGVRGSFMSARRHGQHFAVNALHSPAFLEPAPAPSEKEIVRATLLNAVAQQESGALDAAEAKACLQKPDASSADSARARLQNIESRSRDMGDRVQILKLFAERQDTAQALSETREKIAGKNEQLKAKETGTPGEGNEGRRDVQAIREEIKTLEAGARQQQAKLEGLNRSLTIAEGNSAQAQGARLLNPLQSEMQKLRPQQANMPGQTRQEGMFMFNNMDNQAGLGNDFQRLFNNINRFNQQGTVVVPVLRKF